MLFNKIKWVLGLALVFFLIIATNLVDRNNFNQLKDSLVTIYEDRLVAKDLIFELSLLIHEKTIASIVSDSDFYLQENEEINQKINELIALFRDTKLTMEEERTLNAFQSKVEELQQLEKEDPRDANALQHQLKDIESDLYSLSKIQIDEGKRQMAIGKRAFDSIESLTRIEIYMLVILAIIIQIIILYNPKGEEAEA